MHGTCVWNVHDNEILVSHDFRIRSNYCLYNHPFTTTAGTGTAVHNIGQAFGWSADNVDKQHRPLMVQFVAVDSVPDAVVHAFLSIFAF